MNINQDKKQELTDDEIILQIFKALPKVIQDAILNSGWQNIIRNLVKVYKLRIDQGNELENRVFGLMLGISSSDELFEFITQDLKLPEEQARELFIEIDEKIFNDIYKNVMKAGVYDLEEPETMNQEPENNEAEETLKRLTEDRPKENYVRDDIDHVAKDDEINTLTREELLKGIEKPEEVKESSEAYPDLKMSNVMPGEQQTANSEQRTETKNAVSTPETISPMKQSTSALSEAPVNLPSEASETKDDEPLDPVSAGLSNPISTKSKEYNEKDPYREPIE